MTTPSREAFRDTLLEMMPADERIFCLDSDTGLFTGSDTSAFEGRYLNLGIAEHNLVGTAAGLAASGKRPYVTTMATFVTTRALEFVKIDVAYNHLPVRFAVTHGGLAAGHLGPTHHSLEDLAVVRTLPGMTVVVPGDADQAAQATRDTADTDGPVYLRLGRKATTPLADVVEDLPPLEIGRAQRLRSGGDLLIVACGPHPVLAAVSAAAELAEAGIEATVLNMHTLKPFDTEGLLEAAEGTCGVVTIEEHWRTGGLGSAVAETLSEHAPRRVRRIGMPETFAKEVGGQDVLMEHYGIDHAAVVQAGHDLAATKGDQQ